MILIIFYSNYINNYSKTKMRDAGAIKLGKSFNLLPKTLISLSISFEYSKIFISLSYIYIS